MKELKRLQEQLEEKLEREILPTQPIDLQRQAVTLGIFDALVDQIAYWHVDGDFCQLFVRDSKRFLYPSRLCRHC